MKSIAICYPGTEDICASEIRELCGVDSMQHESAVIFELDEKRLLNFCYFTQSSTKVLGLLGYLKFQSIADILEHAEKINISEWSNKETTFKVKCARIGEHDFRSETIMQEIGAIFHEKDKLKVNLDNPDLILYVHIYDNNCYIGIDLTRMDLGKRDYKMFSPPETVKGPIAYTMLRIGDYDERDVILNPFTGSGTLEIEAALFAVKKSVNYYRKDKFNFDRLLPFKKIYYEGYFDEVDSVKDIKLKIYGFNNLLAHVKYAQKNAKIAGIDKAIHYSKIDLEWLDTKFEKETIDKIISFVPCLSKKRPESEVGKIYKELFYQMEYILKEKGLFVALTNKNELLKEFADKSKLKLIHERQVMQGKNKKWINVFEKQQLL